MMTDSIKIITLRPDQTQHAEVGGYPVLQLDNRIAWIAPEAFRSNQLSIPPLTPDTPVEPHVLKFVADAKVLLVPDPDQPESTDAMRAMGRSLCTQVVTKGVFLVQLPFGLDGDPQRTFPDALAEADRIEPGFLYAFPDGKGGQYLVEYPDLSRVGEPRIFHDEPKNGDVVRHVLEIPWAIPRRMLVEPQLFDGMALDDPGAAGVGQRVWDEIDGRARGKLVRLVLSGAALMDAPRWREAGFFIKDQNALAMWTKVFKPLYDSGKVPTVYIAPRSGWVLLHRKIGPVYVYGRCVIAPPGSPPVEVSPETPDLGVGMAGTFEGWLEVIEPVLRSPAVATVIGMACSATLLGSINAMEPAIVVLVGHHGCGKTTAAQIVASLLGNASKPGHQGSYIISLRTTDNGLEYQLYVRSNSVTILDEVHQAPSTLDWQSMLYMAANGMGKMRADKSGVTRAIRKWIGQILATGEAGVLSKLLMSKQGPNQVPGGLMVRVIEITADDLWSHVATQACKPGGGQFAQVLTKYGRMQDAVGTGAIIEAIEAGVVQNFGHAWPRIITWLQFPGNLAEIQTVYADYRSQVLALLPAGAQRTMERRTKHVAAAMTGLHLLLTACDITGADEITGAAFTWATENFWAAGLEDDPEDEAEQLVQMFEGYLLDHADLLEPDSTTAGWRGLIGWKISHDGQVFVPRQGLTAVCQTLQVDPKRMRAALLKAGWEPDQRRHPGGGKNSPAPRGLKSRPRLVHSQDDLGQGWGGSRECF